MNKYEEIRKYSDPDIVFKRAKNIYGKNVIIDISDKPQKKYKLYNPNTNNFFHFGAMGYEDYTKHKDEKRRKLFQIRNNRWAKNDKYTSSFASYFLLW